jgi:hypothetical protein
MPGHQYRLIIQIYLLHTPIKSVAKVVQIKRKTKGNSIFLSGQSGGQASDYTLN